MTEWRTMTKQGSRNRNDSFGSSSGSESESEMTRKMGADERGRRTMSAPDRSPSTTMTSMADDRDNDNTDNNSNTDNSGAGGNHPATGSQQQFRLPFPWALYDMLEDAEPEGFSEIVSWNSDGTAFKVYNTSAFAEKIAGRYFRQTKYKSFLRQLHLYGFDRIVKGPNKGFRMHDLFRRGDRPMGSLMKPTKSRTRTSAAVQRGKQQLRRQQEQNMQLRRQQEHQHHQQHQHQQQQHQEKRNFAVHFGPGVAAQNNSTNRAMPAAIHTLPMFVSTPVEHVGGDTVAARTIREAQALLGTDATPIGSLTGAGPGPMRSQVHHNTSIGAFSFENEIPSSEMLVSKMRNAIMRLPSYSKMLGSASLQSLQGIPSIGSAADGNTHINRAFNESQSRRVTLATNSGSANNDQFLNAADDNLFDDDTMNVFEETTPGGCAHATSAAASISPTTIPRPVSNSSVASILGTPVLSDLLKRLEPTPIQPHSNTTINVVPCQQPELVPGLFPTSRVPLPSSSATAGAGARAPLQQANMHMMLEALRARAA